MSDKKLRDTGFALACWILVALILLVFFFIKKDTIISNIRHTNFINRVMGKATDEDASLASASVSEYEDEGGDDDGSDETALSKDVISVSDKTGTGAAGTRDNQLNVLGQGISAETVGDGLSGADGHLKEMANAGNQDESSFDSADAMGRGGAGGDGSSSRVAALTTHEEGAIKPMKNPAMGDGDRGEVPMMNVKLCFVTIDSDGAVSRRITDKSLPKTTSPLTASIKALLQGPPAGAQTLLPEGTRLLSAEVRGGVATLNFSEEFAFNPVGVEGYMAQLMQVVYTATAFNTVNSVQFVINGQKVDYLGSEGEWIGSPLSRASFR